MNRFLPAEWHEQSGVMLTWPHAKTDWVENLKDVEKVYIELVDIITQKEKVLIVVPDKNLMPDSIRRNRLVIIAEIQSNDTWARDHGPIVIVEDDKPIILDFGFNGWGNKYPAEFDNEITEKLWNTGIFSSDFETHRKFILEGGSIESDGEGILMTTEKCLLSKERNRHLNKHQVESYLKNILHVHTIHWLRYGFLEGDDTDGHIDTLARFCNPQTIVYVKCNHKNDIHYKELFAMEEELKALKKPDGAKYTLLPLPMADKYFDEKGNILPATYANFLIMNGAVVYPEYGSSKDALTRDILQSAFPEYEIIGLNCLPLIQQHGSLHCITMQLPKGVL